MSEVTEMGRRRRTTNKHHVKPQSRFDAEATKAERDLHNIVEWDTDFHAAWHQLFENMTNEEIHRFIDLITKPGDRWSAERLRWAREETKEET